MIDTVFLARRLGVEVLKTDFNEDIAGMLVNDKNLIGTKLKDKSKLKSGWVILIDEKLPPKAVEFICLEFTLKYLKYMNANTYIDIIKKQEIEGIIKNA